MNAGTSSSLPFLPSLSRHLCDVSPNSIPRIHLPVALLRRRRAAKPPPADRRIGPVAKPGDVFHRASRLLLTSEARLRHLLSDGAEAYRDLRTSVRTDRRGRFVFSCRQSSLLFVRNLLLWSFVVVISFRAILWLWPRLRYRSWWRFADWAVVRRDRSLAGREVVVGRRIRRREEGRGGFKVWANPLSLSEGIERSGGKSVAGTKRPVKQERLPEWWPESVSAIESFVGKEELQREADRLIRVIMDNRMSGKDYMDGDIIQLRRLCKISGAKVSFETANARDSFYRAAVDFVLNTCSRGLQPSPVIQIDGEDARQFSSGLADNIGLENIRAARLIRAAVAARTRSLFLQSWALEAQGRRSETLEELAKICRIHQLFPPEEESPEIEMLASGLERNLRIEQRKLLLKLFGLVCGVEGQKTAAEALGLDLHGH